MLWFFLQNIQNVLVGPVVSLFFLKCLPAYTRLWERLANQLPIFPWPGIKEPFDLSKVSWELAFLVADQDLEESVSKAAVERSKEGRLLWNDLCSAQKKTTKRRPQTTTTVTTSSMKEERTGVKSRLNTIKKTYWKNLADCGRSSMKKNGSL